MDKNVKIEKVLPGKGVSLNLSPFLSNNGQFTHPEVKATEE